jgi:tetratricopeptide (TPR) repeat protein
LETEKALNEPKTYRAIMLSSTFTDLEEHRERAIEAISHFGYMPKVMEHTGPRADADVIESSLNMVRDSVAYVGVISLKYGQTPYDADRNPDRRSITELEFNEALRLNRPVVLFIMDAEHLVRGADVEIDLEKRKKLDEFRERAKCMRAGEEVQRIYGGFDSLEKFSTSAAIAIGNLVRQLDKSASSEKPAVDRNYSPTLSNVPINVPRHFLGRDDDLASIDRALNSGDGRAAITALHGLRGVGKTTLAAAYAESHSDKYRATWWIRAETETTMRADMVGLGVQLGWVAANGPEEQALAGVLKQLRDDGAGILLIYDNATDPNELRQFLPRGGRSHIVVTSNAPNWGAIAAPVQIEIWPDEIGADFLIARTRRDTEREAALALSKALGGLPLAHEQAAAYCERIGIALAEYKRRFEAAPAALLGDTRDVSRDYHDGLTVAKTFALAIDEAVKRHPAAEQLITYAALLAPEPIPLYVFSEGQHEFDKQFGASIEGSNLDEAVAALLAFALVDRESISDERVPSIAEDCIRLHRLVRQVAASRLSEDNREEIQRGLIRAIARIYPAGVHRDPATWPRARRLDAIAIALVASGDDLPTGSEIAAANLLSKLDSYRDGALAAYAEARKLSERALAIHEKALGPDHPDTATSLNNLGYLLDSQGDLAGARPYYERALAIREKAFGLDHPDTAPSLNNLGALLQAQGDLAGARPYHERALAIRETALGPDHPDTARSLSNLGALLDSLGDLAGARPCYERALAINEKALGPDHPSTATSLNNLGYLLQAQGDLAGTRPYFERALAICEKALGPNHPDTASSLNNLGYLLQSQGDLAGARPYYERALAISEKMLGPDHPSTATSLNNLGALLDWQDDLAGARPYYERALAINEKALGPDHPDTALSLNNLGYLLQAQGDLAGAVPYYVRALDTYEKKLGLTHSDTQAVAENTAGLLERLGRRKEAKVLRQRFGL